MDKLIILFVCLILFRNLVSYDTHGVASTQGLRLAMEDFYEVKITKRYAFFGVYDGHAGDEVAKYASKYLRKNIVNDSKFNIDMRWALNNAFFKTHYDMGDFSEKQGSTAVVALIKDNKIYAANTGDSRIVLLQQYRPKSLSEDHKPLEEDFDFLAGKINKYSGNISMGPYEKIQRFADYFKKYKEAVRIYDAGGNVSVGYNRVNGTLAMSRALGDKYLAHAGVIPEPEIMEKKIVLSNHYDIDKFLILASDGLWDVLRNKDAYNLIINSKNCLEAAEILKGTALKKGSQDNITVVVVNIENVLKKMQRLEFISQVSNAGLLLSGVIAVYLLWNNKELIKNKTLELGHNYAPEFFSFDFTTVVN